VGSAVEGQRTKRRRGSERERKDRMNDNSRIGQD
jgi:hypothetical protein